MKLPPKTKNYCRVGLIVLPLALAACSTTQAPRAPATPNPHYKVGAPYAIDGRWYAPKIDETYEEVGLASWYGDNFHGKLTANGEIFDKRRLSAAHKTLPMPSVVEVENLENGRRITVRLNDRGPFVGDRLIDLSHAAANALGFAQQGLARVRVRYLGGTDVMGLAALPGEPTTAPLFVAAKNGTAGAPTRAAPEIETECLADLVGSATAAEAPPSPEIWVEIARLDDLSALESMQLDIPGLGPISVQSEDSGGLRAQLLRVGPFADEAIALASLTRAQAAGFGAARIVRGAAMR